MLGRSRERADAPSLPERISQDQWNLEALGKGAVNTVNMVSTIQRNTEGRRDDSDMHLAVVHLLYGGSETTSGI